MTAVTGRHKNMIRRIRLVCDIVQRHYEPGCHAKSYYRVWLEHVNPVYPMCYATLLRYVSTPLPHEEIDNQTTDSGQLSLFDNEKD